MAKDMPENKDLMENKDAETQAEEIKDAQIVESDSADTVSDTEVETEAVDGATVDSEEQIDEVTLSEDEVLSEDGVASDDVQNSVEEVSDNQVLDSETVGEAQEDATVDESAQTPEVKTLKSVKAKNKKNQKTEEPVPVRIEQRPDTSSVSKAATEKKARQAKKADKTGKKPRRNIFKSIGKGIKGIISELKKVTWPKGKSVFSSTGIVIFVVVLFLVVLFAMDYVLFGLLSLLMGNGWVSLGIA